MQPNGARAEPQAEWSRRRPQPSESDNEPSQFLPQQSVGRGNGAIQPSKAAAAGQTIRMVRQPDQGGQEHWEVKQQSMLAGVVDLRDTVDTDTHTRVAARMFQVH